MNRLATLLSAVTVAIALDAIASPAVAQFADNQQYGGQVLIESRGGLSDSAIGAVSRLVAQRLTKEAAQREPAVIWGAINLGTSGAQLGADASMGNFTIVVAGTTAFDDEQLRTLWDEARQAMQKSLRIVQQRTLAAQALQTTRQRDNLNLRRAQALRNLEQKIQQLETLDGSSNSQEQIEQQLGAAVNLLRQIQLDRVGIDARRKAIDERIDYLRKFAEAETAVDPVITELRKIVAIREEQLANANELVKQRVTSRKEILPIDAELAQARIELFRAQRGAADQTAGAILQELNNDLSKLFVQDAELKARGDALENTVKELSARASVAVRTEIAGLQQSVKSLRERLAGIDDQAAELENKMPVPGADVGKITIRPLEEALAPDAAPANADENK
jgi:hypothetical protein